MTDAALENIANKVSPPSDLGKRSRRSGRYARRGLVWEITNLERVARCGRTRFDAAGVGVRRTAAGVVGYAGVVTCGSVWADPVCNAKVMARRAVEVGAAVGLWQAQAGHCAFMTFTMRHHEGQSLGYLWDRLSKAWRTVVSGDPWLKAKARHGIVGWLRVVEVTYGANGWHVHIHALLFLDETATDTTVSALHSHMFARWSSALQRLGLAAPLLVAQDARLVTGPADQALADYFTKATDDLHRLGLEFTQTQSKKARSEHSTASPWAFLDALEETGDLDALDRWHQWEKGSYNRRQMTWSRGLRELLGLRREATDEEIAAEEVGSKADTLLVISPAGWDDLCRVPARLGELLDAAEQGGLTALRAYLDAHDIDYLMPIREETP